MDRGRLRVIGRTLIAHRNKLLGEGLAYMQKHEKDSEPSTMAERVQEFVNDPMATTLDVSSCVSLDFNVFKGLTKLERNVTMIRLAETGVHNTDLITLFGNLSGRIAFSGIDLSLNDITCEERWNGQRSSEEIRCAAEELAAFAAARQLRVIILDGNFLGDNPLSTYLVQLLVTTNPHLAVLSLRCCGLGDVFAAHLRQHLSGAFHALAAVMLQFNIFGEEAKRNIECTFRAGSPDIRVCMDIEGV
eukprot:GHVO01056354.1.p1 GENE.GHVO01056354.1~~GHVO01056354.1.p1  ORF type:complete len:246 (+),score=39.73 GHVO01056354.1:512-1249(+)